jgi:hypothetical protein
LNYLEYDNEHLDHAMMAPMHNMAEFQYEGVWGRCWFDLGTSDLISLDILINALNQLSKEYVVVLKMIIGGVNEDWPVETRREMMFDDFENN